VASSESTHTRFKLHTLVEVPTEFADSATAVATTKEQLWTTHHASRITHHASRIAHRAFIAAVHRNTVRQQRVVATCTVAQTDALVAGWKPTFAFAY
jgi:hypothetical protein